MRGIDRFVVGRAPRGVRGEGCIMQSIGRFFVGILACVPAALVACAGDDITYGPVDAGHHDATTADVVQTVDASSMDAADATPATVTRLLATQLATKGELIAVDPVKGTVDGRLKFTGFGTAQGGGAPFLIESSTDTVAKLDPSKPWNVVSSWNVAGSDAFDGGESYADPVQVIAVAPNKAYVLRYNRDAIAIIDPSQSADGGAATAYIDLSALQQAGDGDGHVDMAGAIFDQTRKRLYVALANIDLHNVDPMGFFQICGATKSTLIAIDTTTDKLVDLGGGQPGGGVALSGQSPQLGLSGGMAYDASGDRILVESTGCNEPVGDGGMGPLSGRLIEAVSLKTNTTTTLLDLNAQDFPGQMLFVDTHTAFVQLGFTPFAKVYRWDPSMTTLGTALAEAPDVFAWETASGSLIGARAVLLSDGGMAPNQIIRVTPSGDPPPPTQVIVNGAFTEVGGYFGNAALSP